MMDVSALQLRPSQCIEICNKLRVQILIVASALRAAWNCQSWSTLLRKTRFSGLRCGSYRQYQTCLATDRLEFASESISVSDVSSLPKAAKYGLDMIAAEHSKSAWQDLLEHLFLCC